MEEKEGILDTNTILMSKNVELVTETGKYEERVARLSSELAGTRQDLAVVTKEKERLAEEMRTVFDSNAAHTAKQMRSNGQLRRKRRELRLSRPICKIIKRSLPLQMRSDRA